MAFAQNRGSRVFHLMMILPAGFLLLILSLVSLSTMAVTNNRFVDEYESRTSRDDASCILYAEEKGEMVEYKDDQTCTFSIAGGVILAVLAVAFTIVLVVKALFGVDVCSISALIELGMSVLGTVWAFIVSVVITAGLDQTCKAYAEAGKGRNVDKFPCCSYYYGGEITDSSNVYFYEGINASRITAWFAMVLLLFLAGIYTCIVIRSCCGGRAESKPAAAQPEEISEKKTEPNPI